MRILALDPGESFGWALTSAMPETTLELAQHWLPNYSVHIEKQVCSCGAWKLGAVKDFGPRYNLLESLVRFAVKDFDPHAVKDSGRVIYEVAPGLRGKASVWHLGYLATVQRICDSLSIPLELVNASTWKRSVVGKGNASKTDILYHAAGRYWLDVTAPQDAADACCLLAYWLQSVELAATG